MSPWMRAVGRVVRGVALVLAVTLAGGSVCADDPDEPTASRDAALRSWRWFGDLRLLGDAVHRLPGGREDLERGGARFRGGVHKWYETGVELTASVRASVGSDDNRDNRINFDNERADDLRADELSLQWRGQRSGEVILGKSRLLRPVGELLWDGDLRPVGVGYRTVWDVRTLDTVSVAAMWAHPDHPLERGSGSRVGALRAEWRIREGAPTSGSVALAWIEYSDLDHLPASGLGRTNRVENGRFTSDFEMIDLRWSTVLAGHGRWPVEIDLEAVRNLGASRGDEDLGERIALVAGRRDRPRHWELAVEARRLERDAVLAAYSGDEWWFHTAMRGVRIHAIHALSGDLWLGLSATVERRDDLDERLRRFGLELSFSF